MSVAEELAKLEELRKQGTLTQAEFEKQKKAALRGGKKKTSWLLRIPILLGGAVILFVSLSNLAEPKGVPTCDSAGAKSAIKNAFERNSAANVMTYVLLDLTDAKETSFDEAKKERNCTGNAVLNSGRRPISYRLWLTANNNLLVEVN